MQSVKRIVVMGASVLALAASVGAGEAPTGDTVALEDSRQMLAWQAHNAKGVGRQQLLEEARRVQGLIDGLERGDQIDATEVDRTLGRSR